jgi:predicted ArsR family transcriptional regulator
MTPLEAIADPIRLKIVRTLSEKGQATVLELADASGAHVNTIRQHVNGLEALGFLLQTDGPQKGPGRPQRSYRLREGWTLPTGDFRKLAEILAGFILKTKGDPAELQQFGSNWGRYLAGRPGPRDVSQDLLGMLEHLGCSARVRGSEVILSACPCPLIAPENPPLICHLITAVVRGFLEASAGGLSLTEAAHDPSRRLCSLLLKRTAV